MKPILEYVLVDNQGQSVELLVDEKLAIQFGGFHTLEGKRVRVVGQQAVMPRATVQALSIELQ